MKPGKRRAVFLDRDGVLNRAIVKNGRPHPPQTLNVLQIPEDVPQALQTLKKAGFLLICITNQPDVARGTQRREAVEEMNAFLQSSLSLEEIMVCYHDNEDGCSCRKPQPGLLHEAASRYGVDLPSSFMVGDRWKDVETGRRAGCITILIDYQYAEKQPECPPDFRVRSFAEAAECILKHGRGGRN